MTKECAGSILRHLMAFYPKEYPESMSQDRVRRTVDGLLGAYAGFEDSEVMRVYKDMTYSNLYAPKVAEVLKILKDRKLYQERVEEQQHPKPKTPDDKYQYCVRDGVKYRMVFVENYITAHGISYDGVKLIPVGEVMSQ